MENPIKLDDLGVPLFSETSICHEVRYAMSAICWGPRFLVTQQDYLTRDDLGPKKLEFLRMPGYPTPFIEVTWKKQSNTPAYIIPVQDSTQ